MLISSDSDYTDDVKTLLQARSPDGGCLNVVLVHDRRTYQELRDPGLHENFYSMLWDDIRHAAEDKRAAEAGDYYHGGGGGGDGFRGPSPYRVDSDGHGGGGGGGGGYYGGGQPPPAAQLSNWMTGSGGYGRYG